MSLTQVDQGLLGQYAQYTGFKNKIINGQMQIDQRNAGAAVTANGAFPTDRFYVEYSMDGAYSAQRDTSAPAGFINSLKFTTTTADSSLAANQYIMLGQKIEGLNVADLAWGTASASSVTLSFWVRSSLTGTFSGSLRNSSGTRSYPFTYTISAADTWEQKTVTIAGDQSGTWLTTNGIGIDVDFSLGCGTTFSGTANAWVGSNKVAVTGAVSVIGTLNATFYITGVQLEKGSTATSFDYRPYGTEFYLCQRYFESNFDIGTAPANNTVDSFQGTIQGSNGTTQSFAFKVTKRATPTMTYYSSNMIGSPTAGQWQWLSTSNTWANGSSTQTNRATTVQFQVYLVTSLTGGQAGQVVGSWTASSEL